MARSSRRIRRISVQVRSRPLHLIAALTDSARFEYFYLWPDAWLYGDELAPLRGELRVPSAPGLGTDPDAEVLRRFRAD